MPVTVETERLLIEELVPEELGDFLPVYLSNPDFLALTEGSAGEPGRYDLGMLERDFSLVRLTPGRVMAGIRLMPGRESVGVVDWLADNPSDGKPWLGLLIIHADHQHRGLATEAFTGLARYWREAGWDVVRAGVIERNDAGMAFVRRLGFEPVGRKAVKIATGEEPVLVFERELA